MTPDLVVAGSYTLLANAHIAQQALRQQGIESVVQNEHLHDEARGPIELKVRVQDAAQARAILEPLARTFRTDTGQGTGVVCPACGKRPVEVKWQPPTEFLKRLASLFSRHDLSRAELECTHCGHAWSVPW
jgi:hypothetical protein